MVVPLCNLLFLANVYAVLSIREASSDLTPSDLTASCNRRHRSAVAERRRDRGSSTARQIITPQFYAPKFNDFLKR